MKNFKRFIIFVIVALSLFGLSKVFKNKNLATEVKDVNTTLSLDDIGNGKIDNNVITLTEKESKKVLDEIVNVEFIGDEIIVSFKKNVSKPLKNLEKDQIVFIRPVDDSKSNYAILNEGFAGKIQVVEKDKVIFNRPKIEEVFTELVIDTDLIQNQISQVEMYLADGVTLETPEIYLASKSSDFEINITNTKNDGKPKMESIYFSVDKKKIGSTYLSGKFEITDLGVDYKIDYKKDRDQAVTESMFKIYGNTEFDFNISAKKELITTEKSDNKYDKLKDDKTLAYLLFKLGAVPVEIGFGDIVTPSLAAGVFINFNNEGEISIDVEVFLNYNDSFEKGVELVREEDKSAINIITDEESPKVTLGVNGVEINGEGELFLELEAAMVILGIDLASLSIDKGVDAEGNIALKTGLNFSEEGIDLENNLEALLKVDSFARFSARIDILKLANLDLSYQNEFYRKNFISFPKVTEFDGRTVDLTGLEELSSIEEEIDGDNVKDRVVLYGVKDSVWSDRGKYIVIYNGKNNKVLTTMDCDIIDNKLLNVVDVTGDGKKEIHVGSFFGSGYSSYLLEYKDKTYKAVNFKEPAASINITPLDGYKIQFVESTLGVNQTANLTESQREQYTSFKVYNSNGKLTNASVLNQASKSSYATILDIDNDGVVEFVRQMRITGISEGDILCTVISVYEYRDGEFVLEDAFVQAGVYEYTPNYVEAEEFVMKEPTFELVEDGVINLIVNEVNNGYVLADRVQWNNNTGNGYGIDGIDGVVGMYKLSDNCQFASMCMNPTLPDSGSVLDFNGFKGEIDSRLQAIPEIERARFCVAKVENGEITLIGTVYLP